MFHYEMTRLVNSKISQLDLVFVHYNQQIKAPVSGECDVSTESNDSQ